ncbi:hypothetical protein [Parasulfitobacter algicola]|uniref:N-acetyltransferase domain-containing protein n=1 Tax=Parasulfitobacter algicola TaxID=2614809 RepID=A0ABX2IWN9_9RHOB|nr:hypothetical protein [Sulfitobacter algicola]NSX57030.1 hypothetical protein [Sulfitobacter algicola]
MTLAETAHLDGHFAHIPLSKDKAVKAFKEAIAAPDRHGILLARHNDKAIAHLYCVAAQHAFGTGALLATVQTFFVMPQYRNSLIGGRAAVGLMYGLRSWSKHRNVSEVLIHVTSDTDLRRTHKFFGHMGYRPIGGNFSLKLK